MNTRRRSLILWALLLVLSCGRLSAQSGATGTITGSVKDTTGAVVPGATVVVTNKDTGTEATVTATSVGDFTVLSLIPGQYKILAQAPGFAKEEVSGITLVVDQQARVNLTLKPGNAESQTVEVTADAVELDTDTSAISQLVSSQQVTELPLNGRNFMDLLFIGAGAVESGGEQGTMRQGKGEAISINGSRPESNSYLLDGLLNTDQALNTPSVVLSVDAIEQFKVLSETYSAQYGLGANQISVVSKSGTNKLHGALFEFDRNDAFDAKNYFQGTASNPKLRQNQFGYVADGPVYIPFLYKGTDKTFWMANYEGWRIEQGAAVNYINVPTPANLAGEFSTPVTDPATGEPFPGGNGFASIIPTARFSRLASVTGTNNLIPAPNCPSGCGPGNAYNYQVPSASNLHTNQQTYRVDQNLGKWGRVFGRGTYAVYNSTSQNSPSGAIGGAGFGEKDANWAVGHTIPIGSHMVNQFTFGAMDATSIQTGGPTSPSLQTALAFTGVFTDLSAAQLSYPTITFSQIPGQLTLGGGAGFGGAVNAYTFSDNPMWQFSESLSYIHGAHTMTVGADYKKWTLYRDLADDFLGTFNFSNFATGNEVADYLLGTYNTASAYVPGPFSIPGKAGNEHDYKFSYFGTFIQDDWKVDSKLTMNVGVRWDVRPIPFEAHNRMGWLDTSNPAGGMCIADPKLTTDGIAPAGNGFYRYCGANHPGKTELSDFAPRVGGAYRINDKTVARAGFGLFYDGVEGREIDDSGDIYPYVSRQALTQTAGLDGYKSTDQLWPSFGTVAPITGGPNGPDNFIAVIISEKPKNPYVTQWSASLERELAKNTTFEINYVGNKGSRLLSRQNINQAYPLNDPAACDVTPIPASCQPVARRPYANFGTYLDSSWIGHSNYNSINFKFEHRAGDLAVTSVYTWAKSLDDKSTAASAGAEATGWQGYLNNHNTQADYGRSDFNVGQRFVTSFVYDLPFGRGKRFGQSANRLVDEAIGGWETTGIVSFQQGFPMSVLANDVDGLLDSYGSNRANQIVNHPSVTYSPSAPPVAHNLLSFTNPAFSTFGNSARNVLTMPGIDNYNLALFKSFDIAEKARFQFRMEGFNIFNHPQFNPDPSTSAFAGGGSTVQNNIDAANFGLITAAAPPRIIQFGGKFVF